VLNRCSRPGCNNVARQHRKTCLQCASRAAQYMRTYERRKTANHTHPETPRYKEISCQEPHQPNTSNDLRTSCVQPPV
jgi:hypothetical protein